MSDSACASALSYLVIAVSLALINTYNCASYESLEIEVGGKDGWRVPDNNDTSFYTRWAADLRFYVGDSLCKFSLPFSSYFYNI